jgi:hypothetical protein
MSTTDYGEPWTSEKRAKWLDGHKAPPDWIVLTASELNELAKEIQQLKSERENWRMSSVCREKDEEIRRLQSAVSSAIENLTGLDDHLSGNHGMFLQNAVADLKEALA